MNILKSFVILSLVLSGCSSSPKQFVPIGEQCIIFKDPKGVPQIGCLEEGENEAYSKKLQDMTGYICQPADDYNKYLNYCKGY